MKILVMTKMYPEPDDNKGHSQTRTVEYFAKEWVKAGHEVVVIHNSSRFPLPFYFVPRFIVSKLFHGKHILKFSYTSRKPLLYEKFGIKVARFPMFKVWQGKESSEKIVVQQKKKIVEYLESIGFIPDWIMAHFADPQAKLVHDLKLKYCCKSSIVFHRDCSNANIEKYNLRELIQSFDAVGSRSECEALQIQMNLNLVKKPFICYSGLPDTKVNNSSFSDKKFDTSINNVVYAGGVENEKGIFALVDAFNQVYRDDRESQLSIIGEGSQLQNLKKHAKEIKVNENYVFHGWMQRSDVFNIMKGSQCFTMISVGETFGMVYLEAMLCGCIVIASKGGGFDGIIKHGYNGFLCEANDTEALAKLYQEIKKLDAEELKVISRREYDTAIRYTDSSVAKMYLDDAMSYASK